MMRVGSWSVAVTMCLLSGILAQPCGLCCEISLSHMVTATDHPDVGGDASPKTLARR